MTDLTAPSKTVPYHEIRNRHVRLLKQLLEHTAEDEEAALRWAISQLAGLPEHWIAQSPSQTNENEVPEPFGLPRVRTHPPMPPVNPPRETRPAGVYAHEAKVTQLKSLIRRVLEWTPAFPVESGLLDELADSVKTDSVPGDEPFHVGNCDFPGCKLPRYIRHHVHPNKDAQKATANCFQYPELACPAYCQGGRKCVLERSPMKANEQS